MDAAEMARWRLHTVGLDGVSPPGRSPADVVRRFGGVQSQDYVPATWALSQRLVHSSAVGLDRAFADGAFLRTHVLRPTWHFVTPADIGWMLDLTGPRVHAANGHMYRQEELDERVLGRSADLITAALAGGKQLTRTRLAAVLADGGIEASRFRLVYILMYAELEGLICSGALDGKQHTYALLDQRAPDAVRLSRDEALAELTLRYFTSHGPATAKDFSWWSSLTLTDIKAGLAMVGNSLDSHDVDGLTYWSAPGGPPSSAGSPRVHLLQAYDEYVVGYSQSKFLLDTAHIAGQLPSSRAIYNSVVLLDTQVAGHWKRTVKKDDVLVDVALHRPFDDDAGRALHTAVDEFGAFLGKNPVVTISAI